MLVQTCVVTQRLKQSQYEKWLKEVAQALVFKWSPIRLIRLRERSKSRDSRNRVALDWTEMGAQTRGLRQAPRILVFCCLLPWPFGNLPIPRKATGKQFSHRGAARAVGGLPTLSISPTCFYEVQVFFIGWIRG